MNIKKTANLVINFVSNRLAEILGLIFFCLGLMLFVALFTYSPDDPNFIFTENTEIKKNRDTIKYIKKVILHSKNLKLILLTANPMFNNPSEIRWILNMLLMNDNRETIKQNIEFATESVYNSWPSNLSSSTLKNLKVYI